MKDTHEYRGWWWLPGTTGEELPGTLTISSGEGVLDLTGDFGHEILAVTDTEIAMSGRLAERSRILGISSNGELLTTEGDFGSSYVTHSAGVTLSKYRRRVTLVGKHYAASEPIKFDEIAIRASDLTAWTQVRAIRTTAKHRKHRSRRYYIWSEITARWRPIKDVEIPPARGERVFIRFGAEFEGIDALGRGSDHAELTQTTELRLRFARPRSLDEIFDRVGDLRNFLSLAVSRPVAILAVTGYRDTYTDERTRQPKPIEIFWGVPHNPDPPETPRQPHEMLFTLPAVTPVIAKVFRSWFAKQKRLEPVFNLFFGLLYQPDMYSDVRFLLLAQAVETYGYRRGRAPVRRSFRDQVREVLAICPTASRKIIGSDEKAFLDLLTVSRNYYTHYDPAKKGRAAKEVGLHLLSVQLKALIEMAFLRELGFGHRAVDAILTRSRRYEEIDHFKTLVALA